MECKPKSPDFAFFESCSYCVVAFRICEFEKFGIVEALIPQKVFRNADLPNFMIVRSMQQFFIEIIWSEISE